MCSVSPSVIRHRDTSAGTVPCGWTYLDIGPRRGRSPPPIGVAGRFRSSAPCRGGRHRQVSRLAARRDDRVRRGGRGHHRRQRTRRLRHLRLSRRRLRAIGEKRSLLRRGGQLDVDPGPATEPRTRAGLRNRVLRRRPARGPTDRPALDGRLARADRNNIGVSRTRRRDSNPEGASQGTSSRRAAQGPARVGQPALVVHTVVLHRVIPARFGWRCTLRRREQPIIGRRRWARRRAGHTHDARPAYGARTSRATARRYRTPVDTPGRMNKHHEA